jgi:hypothetical protein
MTPSDPVWGLSGKRWLWWGHGSIVSERMERKEKLRYGIVNFEKRKHPRFNIDLPIEYVLDDTPVREGRAANASEGGLMLYLPERMQVGQTLTIKLFFPSETRLERVSAKVQVVWCDLVPTEENWGDYRTGVMFVDITPENLDELKTFLKSLSG